MEKESMCHNTTFEELTFSEMSDFPEDISLEEFNTEPELDDTERDENRKNNDKKNGTVEPDENNNPSSNVIDSHKHCSTIGNINS